MRRPIPECRHGDSASVYNSAETSAAAFQYKFKNSAAFQELSLNESQEVEETVGASRCLRSHGLDPRLHALVTSF